MDSYERGKLPVKIEGLTVEAVTDRAMLCVHAESNDKEWLPKSQIKETNMSAVGDTGYVSIPRWLADKKGWALDDE